MLFVYNPAKYFELYRIFVPGPDTQSVKKGEGSELLPYWQAKETARHSFIDAGRKHDTGSEMKDNVLLTAIPGTRMLAFFAPVPWAPSPTGWHQKDQMTHVHTMGLVQERNHEFKRIQILDNGSRHASPLLQREIRCLSSTAIHYVNIPGRIFWDKRQSVPLL